MEEEEVKFIEPDTRLKSKIGAVLKTQSSLTPDAKVKADHLVNKGGDEFLEQAETSLAIMVMMIGKEKDTFTAPEIIKKISDSAFELKSRSGTFGYNLGSKVAKSLYDYTHVLTSLNSRNLKVIETHLGSLRAIIGNRVKGEGGAQGEALLKGLQELVKLF